MILTPRRAAGLTVVNGPSGRYGGMVLGISLLAVSGDFALFACVFWLGETTWQWLRFYNTRWTRYYSHFFSPIKNIAFRFTTRRKRHAANWWTRPYCLFNNRLYSIHMYVYYYCEQLNFKRNTFEGRKICGAQKIFDFNAWKSARWSRMLRDTL